MAISCRVSSGTVFLRSRDRRRSLGVDGSVPDDRMQVPREEVGVDRAQLAAGRNPVIGQRCILYGAAKTTRDRVRCWRTRRGRYWPGLPLESVGELLGRSEELLLDLSGYAQPRTWYKKPLLFGRVAKTAHRGAACDPPLTQETRSNRYRSPSEKNHGDRARPCSRSTLDGRGPAKSTNSVPIPVPSIGPGSLITASSICSSPGRS